MRPQRYFILMLCNELKHLNNLQEIFIYLICALVVVKCISPVLMVAVAKMLLCMNVQIYLCMCIRLAQVVSFFFCLTQNLFRNKINVKTFKYTHTHTFFHENRPANSAKWEFNTQ